MPAHHMYSALAPWWPLLSPPADYAEEAADLTPSLLAAPDAPPRTMLELGSGGGNLASHLKGHFSVTLSDLSPSMLEVSRALNPECEHVQGDMRTLDLGRTFDLVLLHDAVMYMTTADDLRAALATAARHCRIGGGIAVLPDCVRESLDIDVATVSTGGEDTADGRGLRYMEWSWDPDPDDTEYITAYSFVVRHADGRVDFHGDVHHNGVFPRATWLALLGEAGFDVTSRIDRWNRDVFVGRRVR
ncbi:MAG: trans-aconitate 2-methyltransferase [Vicinamibacterales bacterium]